MSGEGVKGERVSGEGVKGEGVKRTNGDESSSRRPTRSQMKRETSGLAHGHSKSEVGGGCWAVKRSSRGGSVTVYSGSREQRASASAGATLIVCRTHAAESVM